ncbi:MAG: hypothetical protein U0931_38635 [Vulcanimicrobiota bacterium]
MEFALERLVVEFSRFYRWLVQHLGPTGLPGKAAQRSGCRSTRRNRSHHSWNPSSRESTACADLKGVRVCVFAQRAGQPQVEEFAQAALRLGLASGPQPTLDSVATRGAVLVCRYHQEKLFA